MSESRGTALVTGASGFVGSHVVEQLIQKGHSVRCLLRGSSSIKWIPESPLVDVRRASLHDDAALDAALDGVDTVYHLAAVTSAIRREDYFRDNYQATRNLLDATRRNSPKAVFVLCSSQAAAGPSFEGRPISEDQAPRPISPYGESKLEAERHVLESGLRAVVVRPPVVYGPRDRDLYEMFRWAARGLAPLVGAHDQRLSLVHVHDLARAFVLAGNAPSGSTYFFTDGRIHTRHELLEHIGKAVNRRSMRFSIPVGFAMAIAQLSRAAARLSHTKPLLTPDRIRDFCVPDWTCDDSRARRELGYTSSIGIEEGMQQTAEWYRKQKWI